MSFDLYNQTPASNDLSGYFATGMRPSSVKNAGWDIMADLAQFMSLPTAGGTANAQTITNTRACGAWFTGMWVCWMPEATNTGAMTIQPDGLAAKNVFANGAAALAGQVVLGIPAIGRYDGTQVQLINPQSLTGSFTATSTVGFTTNPTCTITYSRTSDGSQCTLQIGTGLSGTSNSANFTFGGVPTVCIPKTAQNVGVYVEDSGTDTQGSLQISASSTFALGKGNNYGAGGFTATGNKAFPRIAPISVTYAMNV